MNYNQLKIFESILAGSLIGGFLVIAATYSTEPRDPALPLSISDYLIISVVLSLITSVVFWSFYKFF
jgi:hypothetical protein